jgi:excisionase family DNA binding protein
VKLMTVTETAEFLDLSRQRVLQLIADNYLPARKVGSVWIVAAKDARAFKRLPRGKAGAPRRLK